MKAGALPILFVMVLIGAPLAAQEERGNRAYRSGDYAESVKRYREAVPEGDATPRLHYNLGTALLQLGLPEEARAALAEALQAQDPELRLRAFYNLGNAYALDAADDTDAAERLRAMVDAYRRALLLDPDSEDAKWNLELALRRLDELERRESMSGPQGQPLVPPSEEGSGEQQETREGEAQPRVPQPGEAARERRPQADPEVGPLPRDLAEQILRAVEERERGLQREKLRRRPPTRAPGPDW